MQFWNFSNTSTDSFEVLWVIKIGAMVKNRSAYFIFIPQSHVGCMVS